MSPSSSRIELIQLFKQVATDQSSSERRKFDPGEFARQVLTSLRSGQHKNLALDLGCEPGLVITSYPASYGQVLSNLFANSVIHAFSDGRPGTVGVKVRTAGEHEVEILFSDDGCGMSSDIRCQAFNPFFTTHRDRGCHGLGLHIVHNVVTHWLGGRIDPEERTGRRNDGSSRAATDGAGARDERGRARQVRPGSGFADRMVGGDVSTVT